MKPEIILLLFVFGGLLTDSNAVAEEPGFGATVPITFTKPLTLPDPPQLSRVAQFGGSSHGPAVTAPNSAIGFTTIKDPKEYGALSTLPLGEIKALTVNTGLEQHLSDLHY